MECNIVNPWFKWIEERKKTVETRINRDKWKNVEVGDILIATEPKSLKCLNLKVINKRIYTSFEECLDYEHLNTAPDYSKSQALAAYLEFYEKEENPRPDLKHGVVVLTITF